MGYTFKTSENFRCFVYPWAPLGLKAVEDAVRECAKGEGIEIVSLRVEHPEGRPRSIMVTISHRDMGESPEKTLRLMKFSIYNPNLQHSKWEDNLAWMKSRQSEMPHHLRGLPVNVDEEVYMKWLNRVREVTGYTGLCVGDLWVSDTGKSLAFGYLTRSGEIAFNKYCKIKNLALIESVDAK